MQHHQQKKKLVTQAMKCGATLIEVILYMTFTVVALLLSGNFMLHVLNEKVRIIAINEVTYNADFAFSVMESRIRHAYRIVLPLSGSSDDVLSLEGGASSSTLFFLEGGVLKETDTVETVPLTSGDVVISDLLFANVSGSAVRMQMTITYRNESGRGEYQFQKTFHTTRIMRNTL